jgi:hypothetical protein
MQGRKTNSFTVPPGAVGKGNGELRVSGLAVVALTVVLKHHLWEMDVGQCYEGHTHTHTHTHTCTHMLTHTCSHTHAMTHAIAHTHTHTDIRMHTHLPVPALHDARLMCHLHIKIHNE